MGNTRRIPGGFTLVELLIVTTLISIVASISVPTLVSRRITANETAVVATLREVAKAELQFHAMAAMDFNYDGAPEYGTLGEMTGKSPLRGSGETLAPNLLSLSLSTVDAQGRCAKHGYYLRVFLPDASGVGLVETGANAANIDPNLARDYWTAVAWPISYGSSGKVALFVNQQGQIMRSSTARYSGDAGPPAGAALAGVSADRIDSQQLAIGTPGADGNTWVVLR